MSCIDKNDGCDRAAEWPGRRSPESKLPINRRRQIRYPLRNSVLYLWEDNGVRRRGHGWTKDVSEEGVYVNSRNCPREGNPVNLVFRLARRTANMADPSVRMEMQAKVLRIDRDGACGEDIGFAALRRDLPSQAQSRCSSQISQGGATKFGPRHLPRAN